MTPLGRYLAEQFGVHSDDLLDPSINTLPGWFVFDSSYAPYYMRWFPNQPADMLCMPVEAPEHFVVRFDLNKPLPMQLNRDSPDGFPRLPTTVAQRAYQHESGLKSVR